jgi:hypothetical protein
VTFGDQVFDSAGLGSCPSQLESDGTAAALARGSSVADPPAAGQRYQWDKGSSLRPPQCPPGRQQAYPLNLNLRLCDWSRSSHDWVRVSGARARRRAAGLARVQRPPDSIPARDPTLLTRNLHATTSIRPLPQPPRSSLPATGHST